MSWKALFIVDRVFRRVCKEINTYYYKKRYGFKEVGKGTRIRLPSQFQVGENVRVGSNVSIDFENSGSGNFVVGNDVVIEDECLLDCSGELIIQEQVFFSPKCVVYTHHHNDNPRTEPVATRVEIGANCWLGKETVILHNAKLIGNNVQTGYRSLISKPVPAGNRLVGTNKLL